MLLCWMKLVDKHIQNEQFLNGLLVEWSFRLKYAQLNIHKLLFLNGFVELTKDCANYLKIV